MQKKKKKKFQAYYLRNELNKILDIYPQISKIFVCLFAFCLL